MLETSKMLIVMTELARKKLYSELFSRFETYNTVVQCARAEMALTIHQM